MQGCFQHGVDRRWYFRVRSVNGLKDRESLQGGPTIPQLVLAGQFPQFTAIGPFTPCSVHGALVLQRRAIATSRPTIPQHPQSY